MGFLKNITSDNGLQITEAYHRISSIGGDKELMTFNLSAYPSRDFYNKNKNIQPLTVKSYSFTPDVTDTSKNVFKQAYEYLYRLEEYIVVTDVLEEGQASI